MDKSIVREVQKLCGVLEDGDFGDITLRAVANKLGIKEPDSDFHEKLIRIAESQVGIFETSKNHGEGIAKYWTATDYPEGYENREPYCAAAVCWMIRETGRFSDQDRPKTPSAFGFESWSRARGLKLLKPPSSVKRGDLVIFEFSHVGIATSDSDKDGRFSTIEANTSGTSQGNQRDGGGVFRKTRNLSSVRSISRI